MNKRDGIFYTKDTNEPFSGTVFSLYENGNKEYEGTSKYGRLEGLYIEWYENGNKRGEWNWKDGGWDGLQRHWHENGQLWFEINSKNGEEISKKCWDENGNEKECK